MNIKIIKLPADQWQKYRDIRLLALHTDPGAFCSTYDEEVIFSEAEWRRRIDVMWFAQRDETTVGLVGLLQREIDSYRRCGDMVSLWVEPTARGHGVGRLLVATLQSLAVSLSLHKIALQVNKTQASALKLYEGMGFTRMPFPHDQNIDPKSCHLKYYMEWFAP